MDYDDGDDLSRYIEIAVGKFETDRMDYWDLGDKENGQLLRETADCVGRQMLAAALSLRDPTPDSEYPQLSWDWCREIADLEKVREEVSEAVQLSLAEDFFPNLPEMATRCYELSKSVFSTQPGPRVTKFVQRLTRCYVAGFYPECVVLLLAATQ